MKGVSSVIAIILLLLITISIVATAAIFFVSNTQESLDSAESSLSAQKERASSVIKIIDSTENTITVKNLGSNPVDIDDINIVGGGDVVDITNSGTIASGQSAILTTESLISGANYSLIGNFVKVSFVPEHDYNESCEDRNNDGDYLDSEEASFSGAGTISNPYKIFLPCQLHGVRYDLSASYELMANISMTGFDSDTNSANGNWIPIGNNSSSNRFTGTFDGNDNTISGIVIRERNQNNIGLFGYIANSDISDVGITNVDILQSSIFETVSVGNNIGALAGFINSSNISNSYSTGNISGGRHFVGGLVGRSTGSINNSYSEVNIKGRGQSDTGGLVGYNQGPINNSYATGDVNATGENSVGGLVGRNLNSIGNSYSTGIVIGHASVGGAVGSGNSVACNDVYWDTQTSGRSTSACGTGQTTSQLQSPTSNTGIYSNWLTSIWNFGTSSEYPRLVWE